MIVCERRKRERESAKESMSASAEGSNNKQHHFRINRVSWERIGGFVNYN